MEVQETIAEPFRLAVDDIKDLHFFAFGKPEEAHEREIEANVFEVTEAMLTIDLREDLVHSVLDFKNCCGTRFVNFPSLVGSGAQVESEGNRRAAITLDVVPEIKAVFVIETALIATPGIFIEDVRKTKGMQ